MTPQRNAQAPRSVSELGATMARYQSQHAKRVRVRGDRQESEAFHRGGDNPASLVVWPAHGTWADPRAGQGGDAHAFARIVAGCSFEALFTSAAPERVQRATAHQRAPSYPPEREVRELWEGAKPIDSDDDVARYLIGTRGFSAEHLGRLAAADVARALPRDARVPRWASCRRPWGESYRIIAPLLDERGRMRSLHARRTAPGDPKGVSPAGHTTSGLLMGDRCAGGVLAGDEASRRHVIEVSRRRTLRAEGAPVGLVIVEGLPDFLAWVSTYSDADEDAPAVIAILSGSWNKAHADRLPDGVTVGIDTDHDASGDAYAIAIARSLAKRRVRLMRLGAR